MPDTKLSPLAQDIYATLVEIASLVSLSVSDLAFESCTDAAISGKRQAAYLEIYHFEQNQLATN
jgi:hypothetical protein